MSEIWTFIGSASIGAFLSILIVLVSSVLYRRALDREVQQISETREHLEAAAEDIDRQLEELRKLGPEVERIIDDEALATAELKRRVDAAKQQGRITPDEFQSLEASLEERGIQVQAIAARLGEVNRLRTELAARSEELGIRLVELRQRLTRAERWYNRLAWLANLAPRQGPGSKEGR